MSASRDRKEASKVLGLAIQARYRKLLEAVGEDEITVATVDLAKAMYDNAEFLIWVLKEYSGVPQLPIQPTGLRPIPKPVAEMPAIFNGKDA